LDHCFEFYSGWGLCSESLLNINKEKQEIGLRAKRNKYQKNFKKKL